MGLALKRMGYTGRVVGVSRPETVEKALELGVIDEGWDYSELQQALDGADLQEVPLFAGGVIPAADLDELAEHGVEAVFAPGTSTEAIVTWLRERLT